LRIRSTHLRAGAAALLVIGLAAGPAATAATKKPAVKDLGGASFVDLQNFAAGEPDHIDPGTTSTLTGAQVAILMFDSLTDTDASGTLVPASASKWATADNGKTWVFTIKKGLKFADGTPVLPSSFKAGWDRATGQALASEVAYHSYIIAGYENFNNKGGPAPSSVVPNDKALTLTVTLKEPFLGFPAIASHPVFSPIPKSMYNQLGKVEEDGTKLLGNGPYMLKEAISKQAGGKVTLIRNPYYAGTPGTLKQIEFRITKDVNAAYNAFESGQGLSAVIPAGKFIEATGKYGAQGTTPVLGTDYWAFNWEDPTVGGTKNVLLRKAIVKAIDRAQIADQIYQGSRKPVDQLVPKGIPGYKTGLGLGTARDLAGAKADFAAWTAAGNKLDGPLRFSFNEGANWDKVATIMVSNLKEAGIDAKLDPFPADGTYFSKMRKGKGQVVRSGWFADYVLYDNFMYPLLHKASIDGDNLARYNSDKFSGLVDQARANPDAAASADLYQQAEKLALSEDVVVMPTTGRFNNMVFSAKVKNLEITPLGFVQYQKLTVDEG
jgi:oligopeptide transport system substrate-binding protein